MDINEIINKQKYNIDIFFKNINHNDITTFCNHLINIKGNIIFFGIGKSENVCNHFSAILNSINIKSCTMSAQNCLHGDIGFIDHNDLVIYISNSGNTCELLNIAPFIKNKTQNIYGIFTNENAKLINFCSHHIILPKINEIDRFKMIPTSSIAEYILFINIVISNIIEINNISIETYAANHPEGSIGKKIYKTARDYMINKEFLSIIYPNTYIKDCIFNICQNHLRCSIIINNNNNIIGLVTDGNIRRYLSKKNTSLDDHIKECINYNPIIVKDTDKMNDIIKLVKNDSRLLSGIPVANHNNELIGLLSQKEIIAFGFD